MLSAVAQTDAAHCVAQAAAAHMQSPSAWSAASSAFGVPARQQSLQVFASAFFPHAEVSESGVEGAGVVGLDAPGSLLEAGVLLPAGVFVLSPAVLAFFDDEVGAGSGAPLHATAASATKEERQRAKQETVFMGTHIADCRPNPASMCAHPNSRKNGGLGAETRG